MNSSHTTRRDLDAAYIAPIGMNIIIYNIIFIIVFIIVLCGCSFGGLKNTEASGYSGDVNIVLPACTAGDNATVVCEWIKVYES